MMRFRLCQSRFTQIKGIVILVRGQWPLILRNTAGIHFVLLLFLEMF